jgi:PEGA domain
MLGREVSPSFGKIRERGAFCALAVALTAARARAAPTGAEAKPAAPSAKPPAAATTGATAPSATRAPADRHAAAARHFESGIKLYHDGNFEGALAEFRAAYRLKPSASSLQNIALCLKRLFRYAEAADTLEQLLDRYSTELSDDQRRVVKDAMVELNSLVGTLVFIVDPPDARVSVDGKLLSDAARKKGVRLNVGEHTVSATAPGYAPLNQVVSIAGGSGRMPFELSLTPVDGFVEVSAADSDAAIAIDGKPLAFHHWRGPVAPGRHYVQVYKQGFKTFEQVVYVELGKTSEVMATLGPPLPASMLPPKATGPEPPMNGFYGLVVLTALGVDGQPDGIDQSNIQPSIGGNFGVRAGYRFWTSIAGEMLVEGGRQQFEGAQLADCDQCQRDYRLSSFRLGPNLRFMSSDRRLRFIATLGVGAVHHELTFGPAEAKRGATVTVPANDTKYDSATASGWDPYLLAEVGAQYNWGHILLEGDAVMFVDSAGDTQGTVQDATWRPYGSGKTLEMIGLGIRVGWSEWTPTEP